VDDRAGYRRRLAAWREQRQWRAATAGELRPPPSPLVKSRSWVAASSTASMARRQRPPLSQGSGGGRNAGGNRLAAMRVLC
jgi:hypothetical protein